MKKLIIEAIEGKFYICKDKGNNYFAIDISEAPQNAKIGTGIIINEDGTIEIGE